MADKLLVASKSFVTTVDGHRVVFKKGKTRIRSSHPLARKMPQMFRDADPESSNVPDVEDTRARPASSGRRSPKSDKG